MFDSQADALDGHELLIHVEGGAIILSPAIKNRHFQSIYIFHASTFLVVLLHDSEIFVLITNEINSF